MAWSQGGARVGVAVRAEGLAVGGEGTRYRVRDSRGAREAPKFDDEVLILEV